MLLLDSVDVTQLLLPGSLERARDETILRLNGIILASRPLGLVAGALSAKTPLPLELPAFLLQLPHRGDRDGDLIRDEGIEQETLNERVDWQGAHFLAQRAASLIAIEPAAIDRVVAIRPRVAQAHVTSTTSADCDAL